LWPLSPGWLRGIGAPSARCGSARFLPEASPLSRKRATRFLRGIDGSNPSSSSEESGANLTFDANWLPVDHEAKLTCVLSVGPASRERGGCPACGSCWCLSLRMCCRRNRLTIITGRIINRPDLPPAGAGESSIFTSRIRRRFVPLPVCPWGGKHSGDRLDRHEPSDNTDLDG